MMNFKNRHTRPARGTICSHAGAEPGTERTSGDSVHGVPRGAPNVLTLSCKNRPPCGAHRGMAAAATERASEGAKCGHHAAVQFEPPEAARRRANGPAVFVRL